MVESPIIFNWFFYTQIEKIYQLPIRLEWYCSDFDASETRDIFKAHFV